MWGSRFFLARHWTARYFDATGGSVPADVIADLSYSTRELVRFSSGTAI